ncbi:thioredoxin family protein [Brumimicrobium mesophilum]|uniref:thioredoxin family protein n=1 Tax=Brumimicrobium mesophilum TaxID=392717 RepID=UPI000D143027|nr:thioredoxin family protein [Brumimicrobium mesophilum]
MAFVELDTDTLQDEISNNETVLVQYSAGWCGNCRIMKPKFKKFAQDHENVKFIVIDAEKNPDSRKLANVDNLPTFAAFKNGELVQQTQTNKTEVLKSFIDETTSN